MRLATCTLAMVALFGCARLPLLPETLGEQASGFTYIPLDPLAVDPLTDPGSCGDVADPEQPPAAGFEYKDVLDDLADVAVRLSITSFDAKTGFTFGTSSLGVENNSYKVVLDYVKTDNVPVLFQIDIKPEQDGTRVYSADRLDTAKSGDGSGATKRGGESVDSTFSIPVYVGVGLRLTADIQVLRGSVNLASLGAIAASVEAGNSTGSLTVQTLGVSGEKIDASLPLPSKLNQTTVENAILAIGAIKALIYDATVRVRVTGLYLPIGDGSASLVNALTSELAEKAIPWSRTCNKVMQ